MRKELNLIDWKDTRLYTLEISYYLWNDTIFKVYLKFFLNYLPPLIYTK